MGWGSEELLGARYTVSYDVTKAQIGQVRVDYDSPEGSWPQYHLHYNALFFGTTTRKVTKVVGLSETAAKNMCDETGATVSTYMVSVKGTGPAVAELLFEKTSKQTTMARVDASGQYQVTITETTTVTDGHEVPIA